MTSSRPLRVLVYPHKLTVGGSQLVALELAAATRDRGLDVTVYGYDGPLADIVRSKRLPFVVAPAPRDRRGAEESGPLWPSIRTLRHLRSVAQREQIEVVHPYEWYPSLESFWGPHLLDGIAQVTTIMSMTVPWFLPRSTPMVVGTRSLEQSTLAAGQSRVLLMEPPIDVEANAPGVDGESFRREIGAGSDLPLAVLVSRLSAEKLDGARAAISAIGAFPDRVPCRLAVVGGGSGLDELRSLAAPVNELTSRPSVIFTGEVADPRPAYSAADIVLGMGSSALRGMAFAKPVIVLGVDGFAKTLTPDTAPQFLEEGFFGTGSDASTSSLHDQLSGLAVDPARRATLGSFGRELVCDRFSLQRAAEQLEALYREAVGRGAGRATTAAEGLRSLALLTRVKVAARASSRASSVRGVSA